MYYVFFFIVSVRQSDKIQNVAALLLTDMMCEIYIY